MVSPKNELDSKFNPLVYLGRKGSFGLSGFINKLKAEARCRARRFPGNDHWTVRNHKVSRRLSFSLIGSLSQIHTERKERFHHQSANLGQGSAYSGDLCYWSRSLCCRRIVQDPCLRQKGLANSARTRLPVHARCHN